jgi:hypothetical protein
MQRDWNMEGIRVEALYMDEQYVLGRIESSRVHLSGRVKHTLVLDEPVTLSWCSESRDRLIINEEWITNVYEE